MSILLRREGYTVQLLDPPLERFAEHGAIGLSLALAELVLLARDVVPNLDILAALRRPPAVVAELRQLPPEELGRMLRDLLALAAPVVSLRSLSRWVITEGVQMLCGVYPPGVEPVS